MKLPRELLFWILIAALSLGAFLPLFHVGFFPMHDNTQVQRVYEMGKALHDGMLPVRWVSDLGYGYGYPIFTFYAPLSYYVGGLFTFLAAPLVATKMMIGLGILLSGFFMYLFTKKLFGVFGGLVASILYLYAPYHAIDIYVRGDIAELWAYAFIPLAFYGFWKISEKNSFKHVVIAACGFAGIILSHNLTALMVTPFLIIFAVLFGFCSNKKVTTFRFMAYALLLGLGLSAFYFLPVFGEMKYTNVLSQVGGGADFHDHFVCLSQLWQSPWGYGGSAKGCVDGLSFMIGRPHLLLSALSLVAVPFIWKKDKKMREIVLFSAISLLILGFLMLPQSVFIWNLLKPMSFLQYPWRFLLLASFFTSILGGSVIYALSCFTKKQWVIGFVGVVSAVGIILFSVKYFVPQSYISLPDSWYVSTEILFDTSKISDEYMPKNFVKPSSVKEVPKNILQTENSSLILNKTQQKKILVNLPKPEKVLVSIAYFPAWTASVDGKSVSLSPESSGMTVLLPKGRHVVNLVYKETLWELTGDLLSLTSVSILILVIIKGQVDKLYGSKSS